MDLPTLGGPYHYKLCAFLHQQSWRNPRANCVTESSSLCLLPQAAKQQLSDDGLEGIMLGGNYVAGVALGKCVEFGYEQAADLAKFVKSQKS